MKVRTVASGFAALAMAGMAVPIALSGPASAKAPSTAAPAIASCAPKPATIGKTVTIKGTHLADATSVTIVVKKTKVTIKNTKKNPFTKDSAKQIKLVVPTTVKASKAATVSVTTANGSGSQMCAFVKPAA